jgi:hypothetical protein
MTAKIFIDPKFHFHPKHELIYQKIQKALLDFPEISELHLSAFYPTNKLDRNTIAWVQGTNIKVIVFNVHIVPTYNTIYHELYHIVQRERPSIKGKTHKIIEAEATLLGTARMPKSKVENNFMCYFNTVPKSKVIKYAQCARNEKEKGNKNYIEDMFLKTKTDKEKEIKAKKSNAKRWKPIHKKDLPVRAKFNVIKEGKNFTKDNTPSILNKYLKTNIRKSQQLRKDLITTDKNHGMYLYEKADLINIPSWMKSTKASSKKVIITKPKAKKSAKKRGVHAKNT